MGLSIEYEENCNQCGEVMFLNEAIAGFLYRYICSYCGNEAFLYDPERKHHKYRWWL